MDRDLDQAAYTDLLQLAKRLAVSVEDGDDSLTLETAYAIKNWAEDRGLVLFWAVFRERETVIAPTLRAGGSETMKMS